jgi:hypothetical protein
MTVIAAPEWELISWIVVCPQLIDDHLDELSSLSLKDRHAQNTLKVFLDHHSSDRDTFVSSNAQDLLDLVDSAGIKHFRRYVLRTFLVVFTKRIADGTSAIKEAFEAAKQEIQASEHIDSERTHAQVDFEGGAEQVFDKRLDRLKQSHIIPPIRDLFFFELAQELQSARNRATQVVRDEQQRAARTGTG